MRLAVSTKPDAISPSVRIDFLPFLPLQMLLSKQLLQIPPWQE
jgi:hypothetical protein